MTDQNIYIGIDAGTQSVKVAAYTQDLQCLCAFSQATTLLYPKPNWVEMDINEFLYNAIDGIKKCTDFLLTQKIPLTQVKAIMADGIICGICGVNKDGNAITPYINYLDSRTQDDVDYINSLDLELFAQETGNPKANCMFPAMFARYFLKNHNQFKQEGVKFIHNAPYILMHLAGLKAKDAFIDWGAMSGWGLGYNVINKTWSDEQLKILQIDKEYLPKILKPWDIVGTLCPAMAEKTGLPTSVKILAGAGDTMQSMLGSGIFQKGQCVDVAGTCAMFCVATDGIVPELSSREANLIFNSGSLENTYFYWGFIRTGGLALRWFKDNICQKANEPQYYQKLSEGAKIVGAGANGVLFIPYLSAGLNELKNASGCFLNMTLDDDQFVMWRAVLEAIGFDYMEITKRYRKAGMNLNSITVTEGGSRDDLWNQIKADMLNTKVVRYKNAGGAVITNCVFAAYALGEFANLQHELQKLLIVDNSYESHADQHQLYQQIYQTKQELVKHDLQSSFAKMQALKKNIMQTK